jgi:chloramphenicol O-acetyltransferase type A
LQGEEVVLYDSLHVGLTVPAPNRTFSFASLTWQDDAPAFLARAAEVLAGASAAIDLTGGDAPDFAYYTALPKVPFSSFTHVALADPTAGQPEAAFGRYQERGGKTFVPVGVLVNHLYVHGADLGDLYEAAQESFAMAF